MRTKPRKMFSLERQTVTAIELIAERTRRDYSAVVDLAIEALARAHYPDLYQAAQTAAANGNGQGER